MKGLYILDNNAFSIIYGPQERADIEKLIEINAPQQTPGSVNENPGLLNDVEVIISGWGGPRIDADFLAAAPNLKAVFYGAGSIRGIVSDAFWDKGIIITSAYAANAVPVAEYTLSQIIFCLKRGWQTAVEIKRTGAFPNPRRSCPGVYDAVIGIISLGMVGRSVCELLKILNVKILAYDPFVKQEDAAALNVELCSLDDIFKKSDVVSLHTPWLKETENMITGAHLASMKEGASFINTARGAVVNEPEMIGVLEERPDIYAVLDVTHPEPPVPGSKLYTLPNVTLTPHIAGSMGNECRRMGRYMVDELNRFLNGEPMLWQIDRKKAEVLA